MGLREQLRAGATLTRDVITFTGNGTGSGSVSLGKAYTILSIETNSPCRLRLYDLEGSRDSPAEISRPFGNTNISASIALVGDFSMSAAGMHTVTPALYGVPADTVTGLTYYRLEESPSATIQVSRYLLDDSAVVSVDNRRLLPIITSSLAVNALSSGTLSGPLIPQTYLLVSASLGTGTHKARLRLYFTSHSLENTDEKNRPFSTEPSASAKLLVDAILSGSETSYFVPKIIGANLANMGSDLNLLVNNETLMSGENELYYVLQNVGVATANISASVHVFALED